MLLLDAPRILHMYAKLNQLIQGYSNTVYVTPPFKGIVPLVESTAVYQSVNDTNVLIIRVFNL